MMAAPPFTASTRPRSPASFSGRAVSLLERHTTRSVKSTTSPFLYNAVAVKCALVPMSTVSALGATASVKSGGGVTVGVGDGVTVRIGVGVTVRSGVGVRFTPIASEGTQRSSAAVRASCSLPKWLAIAARRGNGLPCCGFVRVSLAR